MIEMSRFSAIMQRANASHPKINSLELRKLLQYHRRQPLVRATTDSDSNGKPASSAYSLKVIHVLIYHLRHQG